MGRTKSGSLWFLQQRAADPAGRFCILRFFGFLVGLGLEGEGR